MIAAWVFNKYKSNHQGIYWIFKIIFICAVSTWLEFLCNSFVFLLDNLSNVYTYINSFYDKQPW